MDKIKFFRNTVIKLCGKLKINRPLLMKDNRLGKYYMASVGMGEHVKTKEQRYIIRYNAKMLKTTPKADTIHGILHELGHIKTTAEKLVDKEYKAELFAIKAIKKHYPQHYKNAIDYLRTVAKFNDRVYPEAYKRVLKKIL